MFLLPRMIMDIIIQIEDSVYPRVRWRWLLILCIGRYAFSATNNKFFLFSAGWRMWDHQHVLNTRAAGGMEVGQVWLFKAWNEGYSRIREDFTIMEKAPTALCKTDVAPRYVKLGPQRNYHKGWAAIKHYAIANQLAHPLRPSPWLWNLCESSFNLRFKLYDCWYYDQMSGCQPQCLMSDEARQGGCRTVASENTEYRSTDGKYRESRRSPSTPLGEAVSVSIISRYILIESGIEALHSRQCHSNWIFFGAK